MPKLRTPNPIPQSDELDEFLSEQSWVESNREQYAGKWVAVKRDTLVACGNSAKEVFDAARLQGVELPLIVRVEPPPDAPFSGW